MESGVADPPQNGLAPDAQMDEVTVDGTVQLGLFDAGGKKPTSATISLTGGAIKLIDQEAFKKGDHLTLVVEAVVNDVGQKDEHDPKTGQVVSCVQKHKARIVGVQLQQASAE